MPVRMGAEDGSEDGRRFATRMTGITPLGYRREVQGTDRSRAVTRSVAPEQDPVGLAALYTPDGVFLPARPSPTLGAVITSRANVEKFFADAFKTFHHSEQRATEAHALGDGVWFVGEVHLTGQSEKGPVEINGRLGGVLVRAGGSWEIRMVTVNAAPPEAAAPMKP